ncbi:SDR family oxidoreductase [Roseibium sp. MMSF_3412]|uniref:SDR family oxidoreductase n=1 Tax=Roseibium sp. MMSF_3412 TaxID=3046712 RepID=UPI00273EE331|nr:SDR family oxidoreductase [Roseibium sp. MMSF_3412]
MKKTAVVLGAYGFIGAACVKALRSQGFSVTGIGRSREAAAKMPPGIEWVFRDIAEVSPGDWKRLLQGADVVVNASGALQDGARDNLAAIHETAIRSICEALAGSETRFVQISAAGVAEDAPTDFFRSKARGDAILMASDIDWIVLRPVLVVGAQAYGGTALLRAAAAFPLVQTMIVPKAVIRTVDVEDLAAAVAETADGRLGSRFVADLTEDGGQTFAELTQAVRRWLGYPAWRYRLTLPDWSVRLAGRIADALGWLGWRSPLRTNALLSLQGGITGDPAVWKNVGGQAFRSLSETLEHLPATAQERSFARLYLLLPLAIGCLSLFWILSGAIGLVSLKAAKAVLTDQGVSQSLAATAVIGGSIIDLILGIGVLFRRWTKLACFGMIAVSFGYLGAGTLLTPHLWLDPLGVFVKVLPAIMLALIVPLVLEDR